MTNPDDKSDDKSDSKTITRQIAKAGDPISFVEQALARMADRADRVEYFEKVLSELDSYHYEDYAVYFDENRIGLLISHRIKTCHFLGISYRECALSIFGLTVTAFHLAVKEHTKVTH
jgi:hypothetical protein